MNLSDVFDVHFQKCFVAHLVRDNAFALEVSDEFDPELFEDETLQIITRVAKDFYVEHAAAPGDLFFGHVDRRKNLGDITQASYDAIASLWPDLLATPLTNRQYLLSKYDEFLKHLRYRNILPDVLEFVKSGKFDDAETALHDLITFRPKKKLELGRFFTDDMEDRLARRMQSEKSRFWTLIPELDKRIDGLKAGELGVLQSQRSSAGKSACLALFARSFLMQEKNVLIITLEMDEEAYEDRLDMAFAAVTRDQLLESNRISTRIRTILNRGGRLKIKQFPTGRATVRDLEKYVRTIESCEGFRPDVILLDYADLLKSKEKGLYERGKDIYESLRGWAGEEGFALWTATQSSRSALSSTTAEQEHMSGSVAKTETADLIISINRSAEEEEAGVTRLYIVKARNDASRYELTIRTDFSRMLFYLPNDGPEAN